MRSESNKKNQASPQKTDEANELKRSGETASSGLSEETLRQILIAAGHAYTIWIPGDRNPYISDSLAICLGYFPASFSVSSISELIHYVYKKDRRQLLSALKSVTHQGGNYACDFRMLGSDRNYRWFRIRGTSYEHDEKGTPTRIIGCISDIDELKQAQLQAEKEKEKSDWLRNISTQLFESMGVAKIDIALQGLAEKLGCNRTYLQLKNPVDGKMNIVAESHAEGMQSVAEILSAKYPDILQSNLVRLEPRKDVSLFSNGPELTERQHELGRDLGVRHAAVIPLMQNDQVQGELILMSAVNAHWSEDDLQLAKEFSQLMSLIFEREAIAIGLRESDERFNLAMEASQDGLWDTQTGRDHVYVSPSYFRMTGHDLPGGVYPREITGIYIHPDDLLMVRERLAKFVDSEKENDSIEFRMRHKDGSDVWILSRMYKAEFNADGSASRVIGVNTDITEFKRIQDYLQAAQTEADAANRAKSEFLARMSHEIRTPMNAILGLSHLALEGELQAEQRSYIKHIDDAAQLLLKVINDILDFSKIEAGKLELDETDFDLQKVISRLADLLIYSVEEKDIRLVVDLEPDVPLALYGDATRLQQILVNLLNNAIKFTHQGSVHLHISLDSDKRIVFTVKDSGIGIDKNSQQFLFKPFSQADGSVTRRYGGTGLGLVICKYLVEMMGGAIQFESVKDVGSQFTVILPFVIKSCPAQFEQQLVNKLIAIISNNSLVSQAAKNLFARCAAAANINCHNTFHEFAATITAETDGLCLVDDEALTATEFSDAVTALRKRHPFASIDYVFLGKNTRHQEYSQRLVAPIRLILKPLTPEKIHALLFPEGTYARGENTVSTEHLWKHHKILLVEDNPVNQKVALGLLQKYELDVEVVTDGQQAIDRLHQQTQGYYTLVLMDMEMPTMDGYAATREIRQDARFDNLTIIAMTAHAMKGDRDRCLAAGMNDYISKPINPVLLRETLAKYL